MNKVKRVVDYLNIVFGKNFENLFHLFGISLALDGKFFAHFVVSKMAVGFTHFYKTLYFVIDFFAERLVLLHGLLYLYTQSCERT